LRIDIDTVPFSLVASGGLLAMLDLSGAEYAAVGVLITAIAGSPTTLRAELAMSDSLAGTNILSGGDVFGTPDITGAPVAAPQKLMISRIGAAGASKTTILAEGFLLPPPLKYAQVIISLAGGAAPTVTGTVIIFKYTR
jgi:hypothetical protein